MIYPFRISTPQSQNPMELVFIGESETKNPPITLRKMDVNGLSRLLKLMNLVAGFSSRSKHNFAAIAEQDKTEIQGKRAGTEL